MIVEQQLNLVDSADDVRARVAILHRDKLERLPIGQHLVERLLERVLLGGGARNLLELGQLGRELGRENHREIGRVGRPERLTHYLGNLLPVAVAHTLVAQGADEGHLLLELGDALFERLCHLERSLGHALVRKGLDRLEVALPHRLDFRLHYLGIDSLHRAVQPLERRLLEVVDRVPQRLVRRDHGRHLGELWELRQREAEQRLLLVYALADLLGLLDPGGQVGERRRTLGDAANVAEFLEGLRLRDKVLALEQKVVAPESQLVLHATALGLKPLVALVHLWLHLARPGPRLAYQPELLLIEVVGLVDEEAQRLASLVQVGVESLQQACALAQEAL
eukprot:scaffold2872_cov112-Isochrysis_galbana.AAC.18